MYNVTSYTTLVLVQRYWFVGSDLLECNRRPQPNFPVVCFLLNLYSLDNSFSQIIPFLKSESKGQCRQLHHHYMVTLIRRCVICTGEHHIPHGGFSHPGHGGEGCRRRRGHLPTQPGQGLRVRTAESNTQSTGRDILYQIMIEHLYQRYYESLEEMGLFLIDWLIISLFINSRMLYTNSVLHLNGLCLICVTKAYMVSGRPRSTSLMSCLPQCSPHALPGGPDQGGAGGPGSAGLGGASGCGGRL